MNGRKLKHLSLALFILQFGLALAIFVPFATKYKVPADIELSLYLKSFESTEQVKQYIESNGIFEQLDPVWWYRYDVESNSCYLVQLLDRQVKANYEGKPLSLSEVANACITYNEAHQSHK